MNIQDLQFQIDQLKQAVDNLTKAQAVDFVPKGVNFALTSPQSIDPGHQHVLPPSDRSNIFTNFETFDGFLKGGDGTESITPGVGLGDFSTGSSTNDSVWAYVEVTADIFTPSTKRSKFQTVLKLSETTSQLVYFGTGTPVDVQSFDPLLMDGYGFKVVNGTLSSFTMTASTETLTTISGVTLTNFNEYRVIHDINETTFYVNGIYVAKHTTNLPVNGFGNPFFYYLKTTTTADRDMYVKYAFFSQEN